MSCSLPRELGPCGNKSLYDPTVHNNKVLSTLIREGVVPVFFASDEEYKNQSKKFPYNYPQEAYWTGIDKYSCMTSKYRKNPLGGVIVYPNTYKLRPQNSLYSQSYPVRMAYPFNGKKLDNDVIIGPTYPYERRVCRRNY